MKGRLLGGLVKAVVCLVVLGALAGAAWLLMQPPPRFIQGEVEATKINVAAKITGRVEEMLAREGQSVKKGEVLARLDTPQLQAKQQQAAAAKEAASAQRDKAEHGAREEQIRAAHGQWLQASAARELAEKTLGRVERLYRDGVAPAQQRDEAAGRTEMARKAESAAKAQYDMAVNGTREEDKQAASAVVEQAAGAVSEVASLMVEAAVTAPIDGEVYEHVVNTGELAAAGMPIVTMVDLSDLWVTFNVREDELASLKMGDHIKGVVPGLDNSPLELEVTYITPLGDFALWRATSASGGFDLRTFEVRGRPVAALQGMRPGMSVIVPWKRNGGRFPTIPAEALDKVKAGDAKP